MQSSQTYKNFYKNVEGFKILDNGIAESVDFDFGELLELAEEIGADEVVLPDIIGDMEATTKAFFEVEDYINHRSFRFVGVLQGQNIGELVSMLHLYQNYPEITTLALPRALNKNGNKTRLEMYEQLKSQHINRYEIHFLGASDPANEAQYLHHSIRSIDTSLPVVYGIAGLGLTGEHVARKGGFFEVEFGDIADDIEPMDENIFNLATKELILDNIRTYRSWVEG